MSERCLTIDCSGQTLVGILHQPAEIAAETGILIVVGGPQYRVGSHRQFVVMARALAAAGYPVLRFDCRGMGDSTGQPRTFEAVDEDIRAAIDQFFVDVPGLRDIILFGLCDAASACLIYGSTDKRVQGLILANPWVRTVAGEAKAFVQHYYGQRLLQRSFWSKVFSRELRPVAAAKAFARTVRQAFSDNGSPGNVAAANYIERMRIGWEAFEHAVLLILSDRDLTAREFADLCSADSTWARLSGGTKVTHLRLVGADHTFSSESNMGDVDAGILQWLGAVVIGCQTV